MWRSNAILILHAFKFVEENEILHDRTKIRIYNHLYSDLFIKMNVIHYTHCNCTIYTGKGKIRNICKTDTGLGNVLMNLLEFKRIR